MMTMKQLLRGTDAKENAGIAWQRMREAKANSTQARSEVRDATFRLRVAEKAEELAESILLEARQEVAAARKDVLGSWRKTWAAKWEGLNEN